MPIGKPSRQTIATEKYMKKAGWISKSYKICGNGGVGSCFLVCGKECRGLCRSLQGSRCQSGGTINEHDEGVYRSGEQ